MCVLVWNGQFLLTHAAQVTLKQQLETEQTQFIKSKMNVEGRLSNLESSSTNERRLLESRLHDTEQELRKLEETHSAVVAQFEALKQTHDAQENEVQRCARLAQDSQSATDALAATLATCQAEAQRLRGDVQQLETTSAWLQKSQALLNTALEERVRRLGELENQLSAANERAVEHERRSTELHEQLISKTVAFAAVDARLATAKAEVAATIVQLGQAEREKGALIRQVAHYQAVIDRQTIVTTGLEDLLAETVLKKNALEEASGKMPAAAVEDPEAMVSSNAADTQTVVATGAEDQLIETDLSTSALEDASGTLPAAAVESPAALNDSEAASIQTIVTAGPQDPITHSVAPEDASDKEPAAAVDSPVALTASEPANMPTTDQLSIDQEKDAKAAEEALPAQTVEDGVSS